MVTVTKPMTHVDKRVLCCVVFLTYKKAERGAEFSIFYISL